MPRLVSIEDVRRDPSHVPPEQKAGVLALERIGRTGLLDLLDGHLEMFHSRGHQVRALFASAVLFLSAGPLGGIRPFLQAMRTRTRSRLGALVGVRSIATAPSLSRKLSRLEHDQVRPFVASLLKASVCTELLSHPAVLHLDAIGNGWHVTDVDPTIDAARQRDLPEGDDLPDAKRRASGEPGYVGRKRGEVRQRLVPVMHDGAGVWLAMWLVAEEGSIVTACAGVLACAMATLSEHGGAHSVIVRGDGEFGSAGAIRAIIDSGAHPLVRLTRYTLIDREQVTAHLRGATWYPMRPGESGVKREAAEVGTFTLRGSTDSDNEAVVTVRVVVTRFRRESPPSHGVKRDGHQLELFATTLDPVPWPAPDVAELYAGRGTIENRFAQEDREFNVERTFSFHPPGQEWMCGVALFLWNELVRAGMSVRPAPEARQPQALRPPLEIAPVGTSVEDDVSVEPIGAPDVASPSSLPENASVRTPEDEEAAEPVAPIAHQVDAAKAALGSILSRVYTNLGQGWRVEPERGHLRCPQGRRLLAYSATRPSNGSPPRLAVRTEPWACDGCPIRSTCYTGVGPYKQIGRTITDDELVLAARALHVLGAARPPALPRRRAAVREPQPPAAPRSEPLYVPPAVVEPGEFYSEGPRFLPAAARRAIRELARAREIVLRVGRATTRRRPQFHPFLVPDAAARAHRRRTRAATRGRDRVERTTRTLNPTGTKHAGDSNAS